MARPSESLCFEGSTRNNSGIRGHAASPAVGTRDAPRLHKFSNFTDAPTRRAVLRHLEARAVLLEHERRRPHRGEPRASSFTVPVLGLCQRRSRAHSRCSANASRPHKPLSPAGAAPASAVLQHPRTGPPEGRPHTQRVTPQLRLPSRPRQGSPPHHRVCVRVTLSA